MLLQCAHDLRVKNVDICKVLLSESVTDISKPLCYMKQKEFCYSAHSQSNNIFSLERSEQNYMPSMRSESTDVSFRIVTVQQFKQLLCNKSELNDV